MGLLSSLFSPPNSYDIRKIKRGMTKEQVRSIFGKPKEVTTGSLSTEQWIYTIPFRVFTSIDFDLNGRVSHTYRSGEPVKG